MIVMVMVMAMRSFGRHGWCVVEQIGLRVRISGRRRAGCCGGGCGSLVLAAVAEAARARRAAHVVHHAHQLIHGVVAARRGVLDG